MSETEFLIGRNDLNLQDDFYPDDLPNEWRFDYYSNSFAALSLPIDTDEDLEQIFAEIEDAEGTFELVLTIEQVDLMDENKLSSLLQTVADYKDKFTLFSEIDDIVPKKILAILDGYRVCFQSKKQLKIDLKRVSVVDKNLCFNDIPVFYSSAVLDEKQIRTYLEKASKINTKTILICKYAESEVLNKIHIISEMLGF